MSTPLVILAAILAFFALVLIPFMMFKGSQSQNQDEQHAHGKQGKKPHKKMRKKR
jgi:hypothetical protein